MNQIELSRRSGVNQSTLSCYLSTGPHSITPGIDGIVALARALRCTVADLTGDQTLKDIEQQAARIAANKEAVPEDIRKLAESIMALPPDDWRRRAIEQLLLGAQNVDKVGE